jgi:hypothetical protein
MKRKKKKKNSRGSETKGQLFFNLLFFSFLSCSSFFLFFFPFDFTPLPVEARRSWPSGLVRVVVAGPAVWLGAEAPVTAAGDQRPRPRSLARPPLRRLSLRWLARRGAARRGPARAGAPLSAPSPRWSIRSLTPLLPSAPGPFFPFASPALPRLLSRLCWISFLHPFAHFLIPSFLCSSLSGLILLFFSVFLCPLSSLAIARAARALRAGWLRVDARRTVRQFRAAQRPMIRAPSVRPDRSLILCRLRSCHWALAAQPAHPTALFGVRSRPAVPPSP